MSGFFRTVPPRSFCVNLGGLYFYGDAWKLSGTRQCVQQGGVQGANIITESSCRAKVLELTGKVFYLEKPSDAVLPLDTAIREKTLFSFLLRDIRFSNAYLIDYEIREDAGGAALPCTIRLIVSGTMVYVPPDEESTDTTSESG